MNLPRNLPRNLPPNLPGSRPGASLPWDGGAALPGILITGTVYLGGVLTAPAGLASYQWMRDGVAIGGATSQTYTLVLADTIGPRIQVSAPGHVRSNALSATPRQARLSHMRALGFYASWPMYADLLTVGSGVISQALDEIAARAMTFASGHRPAYDTSDPTKPHAVFAGAEGGKDAAGLLNGLDGVTWVLVLKSTLNAVETIATYTNDSTGLAATVGASFVWKDGATALANMLDAGAKENRIGQNASLDTTTWHVHVIRAKYSDGTTSTKAPRTDGSTPANTRSVSGDSTGGALGNFSVLLGTALTSFGAAAYPLHGSLCHLAIGPYLSDADADAVQVALRAEWGTP